MAPLPAHSQTLPLCLNDPFNVSNLSDNMYYDTSSIMFVDEELPPPPPSTTACCSVCGMSKGSIAVLEPCSHPLCSACLTSALNIVGEKDMQCAVCKGKVDDFKIHKPGTLPAAIQKENIPEPEAQNIFDAYKESFGHPQGIVDDDFEDFLDRAQGASTPLHRPVFAFVRIGDGAVGGRPVIERAQSGRLGDRGYMPVNGRCRGPLASAVHCAAHKRQGPRS